MEQKIQMLIQFAVRTFGPILLRGGLGGGGTSTTNTDSSKSDDDDFDDFDDDDNEVENKDKSKVSISLPTFAPDSTEITSSSTTAVASVSPDESSAPSRIDLFDSFDDVSSSSTPPSVR